MGAINASGSTVNQRLFKWSIEEIRHGQLWPISIALTLIIACVFALTALAERMEQVVLKQGKDALTADLVYVSSNPVPPVLLDTVSSENSLEQSTMTRFATMAFSDQQMQLVTVKAVQSSFPLRGELLLESTDSTSRSIKPGELWLDERVFALLDITNGDVVTIGDADFVVSGKIAQEPGISFNPFQQMPTVMIHNSDIEKTGALRLGSRVRFSLFLTGEQEALQKIKESVELTPSDRWRDQDSGSRSNDMFQRTTQYLSLTVAIVIIMAATTLVLTCQNYVTGRRKTVAMLKSLGASKSWLIRWLSIQIILLFVIGVSFGLLFGVSLEVLLRIPLTDLLPDPLPGYGITPAITAIASCLLIGVPALGIPLLSLINTSAVNVMQPQQQKKKWTSFLLILVPLVPMLIAYRENTLVWIVLGGIIGLFLLLGLVSILIIRLINYLPLNTSMKLAVSRIRRSSLASMFQFGSLAISLMLLAVIWLVRSDLLQDWQQTIPEDAPNVFAINIAPYQQEQYLQVIDNKNLERSEAYPIIRGRLAKINGQDAKSQPDIDKESDSLSRELNFTWSNTIPDRNPIISGSWSETNGVSVESEVAQELNIKVGDTLGFVVNSQEFSAEVNSIREVEWREMKPNFYFIFTPDVLEKLPANWMVSFRVDDNQSDFLNQLSRDFPTVSLMDIRAMGDKIRGLLTQIIWSITVLAGLGVVAGVLLIFTLLRLSLSQRQDEIRLYRTLGASRKRITATIWSEYGLMAATAGLVASMGAELSVNSIMTMGFDLQSQLHGYLWISLPVIAFVVLALVVSTMLGRLLKPIRGTE
ncbi:ABC transporter permease [Vibrio sp. MACH09]|uniref:ABC transporter permease n=1 Tax=Vibrio sp. MACH09 TaxID=3025122 RepID=UPI00278F4425|nr:ABC transporter permease [Vibrio sp. MACH09]